MNSEKNVENKILTIVENMLEVLQGGISITDAEGYILKLGKSCQEMYGISKEYIGKHLSVLEEEGIFRPSLTRIALKERRKMTMTQPDKNGNPLLVTSVPIFNPDTGRLLCAISYASWDINNGLALQERYSNLLMEMTRSSMELAVLKKRLLSAGIVACSPQMKRVAKFVERVADVDVEVLICGETGSGKSNLAKYIHQLSSRKNRPFGQLRCSAFSQSALENELFGSSKVCTKTDETIIKNGLCESLNTGTLLIEDIESMGRDTQAKFLYLLENKHYYRKDGAESIAADIRFIATTRKAMRELSGFLEPNLYYRLTVVHVDMPSLINRKDDIPDFVEGFLKQFNEKYQKKVSITPAALELLQMYSWPGNVTELKCLIQQLTLTMDEDVIRTYHLPDNISPFSAAKYAPAVDLRGYLEYHEERLILQAYDKCKTTVKLAKYLGISQATAVRKLQKYLERRDNDNPIQK